MSLEIKGLVQDREQGMSNLWRGKGLICPDSWKPDYLLYNDFK